MKRLSFALGLAGVLIVMNAVASEAKAGERNSPPQSPAMNMLQGQGQYQYQMYSLDNNVVIQSGYNSTDFPVSTAYASAPPSVTNCLVGVAGGAQSKFLGLSLSGSYESDSCNKRALADVFFRLQTPAGMKAGIDLLCQIKEAKNLDICQAPKVEAVK
jgi:hypothetical protein